MIGRPLALAAAVPLAVALWTGASSSPSSAPQYTHDDQLKMPERYREWVFLSSGVGMTYGPNAPAPGAPPTFDNVFVEPTAYRHFLETGQWPDPTMFVLEIRASESGASINKGGHFQTDVVAVEAAVKDSRHPSALGPDAGVGPRAGIWSYYSFDDAEEPPAPHAKALPTSAACYSCHAQNTAVDNTFVQFYPVLYETAMRRGTLKPSFERLPITPVKLHRTIAREGWTAGEAALNDVATRAPQANAVSEATLNAMGNRLMREQRTAEAVSLLEWAARRYPTSARIQESLAAAKRARQP